MQTPNYSLKDEIGAYWSDRAATFDQSASHRIEDWFGMPEWHRFLHDALNLGPDGTLVGQRALDIACGTGEISRVLTSLGADVTAIDFSETMLGIAAQKLKNQSWRCVQADAEALNPLADATFDLAVTRHLAWTLTNPPAAYAEWRRVIKPGGRLVVVDGNWAAKGGAFVALRRWLADRLDPNHTHDPADRARHEDIRARLHYAQGLTMDRLTADLHAAGFVDVRPVLLHRLYRHGMRGHGLAERLRQTVKHRFAVVAR